MSTVRQVGEDMLLSMAFGAAAGMSVAGYEYIATQSDLKPPPAVVTAEHIGQATMELADHSQQTAAMPAAQVNPPVILYEVPPKTEARLQIAACMWGGALAGMFIVQPLLFWDRLRRTGLANSLHKSTNQE